MKPALCLAALVLSLASLHAQETPKLLRAGMVGLDTSHVPAFTKLFNHPQADGDLAGIKIVAGYPGGTDMPASATRVEKFTQQMRDMGVEIVDSIPALMEKVDVVLLESVDGRIHLQEAREIFKAGKPVFIDKPLAGSLAEAVAIVELAKKHGVPFFSSSSSRFGDDLRRLLDNPEVGDLLGAATWGPCSYQAGTPDMFFYGIHGIEALFTLMGTGCETVSRTKGANHDQVTGVWKDGRVGAYRGIVKGKADFGAVAYGSKGILQAGKAGSYEPLCRQIGKFFRTGQAPVSPEETLEIFAFMEAADESLRQGGKPVALAEVLAKARAEAAALAK
jgi:predicted dehydrogenase